MKLTVAERRALDLAAEFVIIAFSDGQGVRYATVKNLADKGLVRFLQDRWIESGGAATQSAHKNVHAWTVRVTDEGLALA